MLAPKIINLEKLALRPPQIGDAEAIFEYASDPEVVRYMDWPISTNIEQIATAIPARIASWEDGTEFNWVITLPEADRAIGSTSCKVVGHSAEFGYLLNKRYWGNGFATSVTSAIVEWALSVPSIWRVWATCDAENFASARVLEKAGLTREGILRRAIVRPNIGSEPRDAFIYSRVK